MSIKIIDYSATNKRIRKLIAEKGLTPKQIQRRLQLSSVQAVYKWISKSGNTIPSIENLVMLAEILECQVDDILVKKEVIVDSESYEG